MNIRPQALGCFYSLDKSLSSAYSFSFSACQLSVGLWFVREIALSNSGQLGTRSCRLIQPSLINKTLHYFVSWNRAQRYQPGYLGWSWKNDYPKFFSFCTHLFKFKFITKFGTKKYDVPLLSVSYCNSYSKRALALVWRIELNIILQYIKMTYWIKYEVEIR